MTAADGMGAGAAGSAAMVRVALVLKLGVVPAALAVLAAQAVSEPHLGLASADPWMLAAALAANQAALLLFAVRMRVALAAFGIGLRLLQSLRVHLQSVFYFFVLPMTVGQEVARFAKVKASAGPATANAPLAYALLADRAAGALAALVIAAALAPFVDFAALVRWEAMRHWLVWIGAGALGTALLLAGRTVRRHARELAALVRAGARGLAGCLALALVTHLCFAGAVHLAAIAVNVGIRPEQTLFAVSAGMLFVVIPVSFAGVSPVEAASLGVLVAMGFPVEQAAVFSLIVYLAKLMAAFEGGAWEIAEGGGMLRRLLARPVPPAGEPPGPA